MAIRRGACRGGASHLAGALAGLELRWEDTESDASFGELRVELVRNHEALTLWLREARPDALWSSDGVQITCSRPRDLPRAGEIRKLLSELSGRFGDAPPSTGDLKQELARLRAIRAATPDASSYHRVERTTQGARGFLRLGFRCNQDCFICPQSRAWSDMDEETVAGWVDDMASQGVEHLTLSGGEPTIFPFLPRIVERATRAEMRVLLQTNAVRLAQRSYLDTLVARG